MILEVLNLKKKKRSVLHSKCILVDDKTSFITSANFTDKSVTTNIESGVLIKNHLFTVNLKRHYDALIENKILIELKYAYPLNI